MKIGDELMPSSMTNLNIRMDSGIKKEAEELFAELGLNFTTAFNVFVKQCLRTRSIPFAITAEVPNSRLYTAMEESDKIANDNRVQGLEVHEFFKELDK